VLSLTTDDSIPILQCNCSTFFSSNLPQQLSLQSSQRSFILAVVIRFPGPLQRSKTRRRSTGPLYPELFSRSRICDPCISSFFIFPLEVVPISSTTGLFNSTIDTRTHLVKGPNTPALLAVRSDRSETTLEELPQCPPL